MVAVTGSVTKRPRDRDLPVGTDATSTPRGVRPRATGETDVMVLDRGRTAHNPAVAAQPRPLPIGLSRANGQLWGSCYSPLNGTAYVEMTSSVRVGAFWSYMTSIRSG
jgi:hypothetical protein